MLEVVLHELPERLHEPIPLAFLRSTCREDHSLRLLCRFGLLRPVYRSYARLRSVGPDSRQADAEMLPIPPAKLRIHVAGTADLDCFLESGRLAEETLRDSRRVPVPRRRSLRLILRRGGFLLVSTHGELYLELNEAEREAFRRGEVVVRFEGVADTNPCTTFHPPAYVRAWLGVGLELVEEVPGGAKGNPHQGLYLFRKRDARGVAGTASA